MALIAVGYVKSRPGASTVALGLAAALPVSARPVVMECDPAGGDLAARWRLPVAPGLVQLATASRATTRAGLLGGRDVMGRFTQQVRVGDRSVDVVVAPPGATQTRVALSVLATPGHTVPSPVPRVVVADCGRLDESSVVWPLLSRADVALVLVRGRRDEVAHLRELIGDLVDAAGQRLVVLLAAGGEYTAPEVAEYLTGHLAGDLDRPDEPVTVRGPLPYDERGAAVLGGDLPAPRRWQRLPLPAALHRVAEMLAPLLPAQPEERPASAVAG